MDGIDYTKEYNLPNAGTFPYDIYIKQMPYTFVGNCMKTMAKFSNGRPDLTKTFIKENNKWIPLN